MLGVISVPVPDSVVRWLIAGTATAELAQSMGPRFAKAATVDGHDPDPSSSLPEGVDVVRNTE